jgi:hypothetical protein
MSNLSIAELFTVEGMVFVITGGGTGQDFTSLCSKYKLF